METIGGRISALRFFFVKVLRRPYREIDLVYPKRPERLPVILSEEEVGRLIESACSSYHRVILMTLYGTGLRREGLSRLKLSDVGSEHGYCSPVFGCACLNSTSISCSVSPGFCSDSTLASPYRTDVADRQDRTTDDRKVGKCGDFP